MSHVLASSASYNEHQVSARGVKLITTSSAQRGRSLADPTLKIKVLIVSISAQKKAICSSIEKTTEKIILTLRGY